ncbi:MAG: sigma-70 family RNA polymerase sigma factor [Clostridiales bacterium]|nr:sigma-70 family RNA polymerase sigma factor [Clostridiales bacterium]
MKAPKKILSAEEALFIECIYKEYHVLMFSVSRRFGLKKQDQEDLVSTVMISLMNNATTLRKIPSDEQKYYITRAVISTAINHLKRQKIINKRIDSNNSSIDEIKSEIDLEETVILKIELANVISSIMSLSKKESQCIRLKYLFGYNNTEIAERTSLSENSVNQYIMRARKRIRKTMYDGEER